MTLEHKVPTQLEIDAFIDSAKDLRRNVLADMAHRFLKLLSAPWQSAVSARFATARA